ncbi:MAG: LysR family transcriptional regulator [Adlercreutzia equolifaciens]
MRHEATRRGEPWTPTSRSTRPSWRWPMPAASPRQPRRWPIPQSGISHMVSDLERDWGVALFERSRRGWC